MPLNTPFAAANDTDEACAHEKQDCNLAAVRHERIAPVGRVGIQMRPGPYRAEGGMHSKVGDNHRYNHRARSQSGKDAEAYEDCRDKLYPTRNIYQHAEPVRIRPSRKAPQQERFLRPVQPKQECEGQSKEEVKLIGAWLGESPEKPPSCAFPSVIVATSLRPGFPVPLLFGHWGHPATSRSIS